MEKTSKKTTQLGIRFDSDLMEQIQQLADWEEVDKNIWIKHAVSSAVQEGLDDMADQITEDYIKARIDDEEYLEHMNKKRIPDDVKAARKNRLQKIGESEF